MTKINRNRALLFTMINFYTDIEGKYFPLVAIDLGYSRNKASCGIMHEGIKEPTTLKFGATIKEVIGVAPN